MRLINADDIPYTMLYKEDFMKHTGYEAQAAWKKDIDALPTVDAVPLVHGKWVKSGRWGRVYRCDQCGNYLDFDGVNVGRGDANYCPNCGARMVEE